MVIPFILDNGAASYFLNHFNQQLYINVMTKITLLLCIPRYLRYIYELLIIYVQCRLCALKLLTYLIDILLKII